MPNVSSHLFEGREVRVLQSHGENWFAFADVVYACHQINFLVLDEKVRESNQRRLDFGDRNFLHGINLNGVSELCSSFNTAVSIRFVTWAYSLFPQETDVISVLLRKIQSQRDELDEIEKTILMSRPRLQEALSR